MKEGGGRVRGEASCFMRIRFICALEMIESLGWRWKPIGIQQDLICSLQFRDDGRVDDDDDGEVAIYALLPLGDSIR